MPTHHSRAATFFTMAVALIVTACDGGSNNAATSPEETPDEIAVSVIDDDSSEAFDFSGTAGFETGLIKLAKIDGRLNRRNVTINWGDEDEVETDALYSGCRNRLEDCEIWGTHLYENKGIYVVKIKYKRRGTLFGRKTVKGKATIKKVADFVVVAIGDSTYSGEGAPLHHKSPSSNALWDEPAANYFKRRNDIDRAVDGNGNEFLKDSKIKQIKDCHRSAISGPRRVDRKIAETNAESCALDEQSECASVTLIHMACSGASLGNATKKLPSGEVVRDTANFINEQLDWVRTRVPQIDVLLIAAGANNVGVSDVFASDCLSGDRDCDGRPNKRVRRDKRICDDESYFEDGGDAFTDLAKCYADLALDINCRSENNGGDEIGPLCTEIQYATNKTLRVDKDQDPVELRNVAYKQLDKDGYNENGERINTRAGKFKINDSGCYNFLLDATDIQNPTIQLSDVEKSGDSCGVSHQGFDNAEPFGLTIYLRGEFDGWAREPDRRQRFINMGDGTLQAEFEITHDGESELSFKVASLEERLIPAVTLINQYGDFTRNAEGGSPSPDSGTCIKKIGALMQNAHDFTMEPLNRSVRQAANEHDWYSISMEKFDNHGYCVEKEDRWVLRLAESLARQGDKAGTAHPNADAHDYYEKAIYDQLRNVNPPRTSATAKVGGVAYQFDTITSKDVEVTLQVVNPLLEAGIDGSGTYFSINGTGCNAQTMPEGACMQYTSPFTISESGVHSVSFYSLNESGKPERRVWPVTVHIDKDPPVMTCSASPNRLWPPNGELRDIDVTVTADDAEFGPTVFRLAKVLDSENNADEDILGFDLGTADVAGQMRSSRKGGGTGRIYTLVYESTDGVGNVASCLVDVAVSP